MHRQLAWIDCKGSSSLSCSLRIKINDDRQIDVINTNAGFRYHNIVWAEVEDKIPKVKTTSRRCKFSNHAY